MKDKLNIFLYLFIFTIPLENVIIVSQIGTISKITGMLSIIGILGFGLFMRRKLYISSFHWIVFIFVILVGFSYFWSADSLKTISRFITYLGLFLITLMIYQIKRVDSYIKNIMFAFLLGAWISTLDEFKMYFTYSGLPLRYTAPGFNPNDFAFYLLIAICFAWYLGQRYDGVAFKLLSLGYIPLGMMGILLTGSRAGFLGLIIVMAYIVTSTDGKRRKRIFMGLAALVISIILIRLYVPEYLIQRVTFITHVSSDENMEIRLMIWKAALQLFYEHPVVGAGAGTFNFAIENYLGFSKAPHNVFIAILSELGVMGLLVWGSMIILIIEKIKKNFTDRKNLWICLFLIILLISLTHNLEWRKGFWLIFSLIILDSKISTGYEAVNSIR